MMTCSLDYTLKALFCHSEATVFDFPDEDGPLTEVRSGVYVSLRGPVSVCLSVPRV